MRWSEGVKCPQCGSATITKRGQDERQKDRQRYACRDCQGQVDDLTGTIFEGPHQPVRVWILCLYFMGLNLSNQQLAAELDLNTDDVQTMPTQLRAGIVAKKSRSN